MELPVTTLAVLFDAIGFATELRPACWVVCSVKPYVAVGPLDNADRPSAVGWYIVFSKCATGGHFVYLVAAVHRNHILPSGPVVMPTGLLLAGTAYS